MCNILCVCERRERQDTHPTTTTTHETDTQWEEAELSDLIPAAPVSSSRVLLTDG